MNRHLFKTIALVTLALAPTVAFAQSYTPGLEITPTIGYRWGGELTAENNDLFDKDTEVDSSEAYGLLIDIPLSRSSQIELMASRQSTSFSEGVLFPEDPTTRDVDLTYYHVGYLYQWTPSNLRPFVVGSLGFTDINPEGAGSENRFSGSIGGGLKVDLSRNVGFRLEARGFWTDTGSTRWYDDCDDDRCRCWDDSDCSIDLFQSEIRFGLMVKF